MQNENSWGFVVAEDHASADYVFDAYGESLGGLFIACADACFTAMTDPALVEPLNKIEFELTGGSPDELLFSLISELIYLKDFKKMFFSKFEVIISPDEKSLRAVIRGEQINYDKHVIKTDVKAVTYHNLHIRHETGRFVTRMMLDL
jgi:SHS2 domain-containing protein